MSIKKRIEALEAGIMDKDRGVCTVTYKDGSTREIKLEDAIYLVLEEADAIESIEADPDGAGEGLLCGLIGALLSDNDE